MIPLIASAIGCAGNQVATDKPEPVSAEKTLVAGQFSTSNQGIRLSYRVAGKGPPCIMTSPGWGPSADLYANTMQPLQERYTMIYLDARGSGRSDKPTEAGAYKASSYAADIEAVRIATGQETICVMGHSGGGLLVMQYALEYPERVSELVLLNTLVALDEAWQKDVAERVALRKDEPWFAEAAPALARVPKTSEESKEILIAILPFYFYDQKNIQLHSAAIASMSVSVEPYAAFFHNQFDFQARGQEITAPALIITGRQDFIASVAQAERLHKSLPSSRLVIVEEAGHMPWMENMAGFLAAFDR